MSNNIKSKDLSYDKQEPAFLKRLRGQFDPDGRQNVQTPRPQRSRMQTNAGDDDDGPVVLDESGREVGKDEWKAMENGDVPEESAKGVETVSGTGLNDLNNDLSGKKTNGAGSGADGPSKMQQGAVEIGGPKKRRGGKVIGGDDEAADETIREKILSKRRSDTVKDAPAKIPAKLHSTTTTSTSKTSKLRKKIKLSFDEGQDD